MAAALLRRIRGSGLAREIAARLIAAYLRLCRATGRWSVMGEVPRALARSGRGRHILAIWHGRLCMVPGEMHRGLDVRAIISRSRDGEIIARIVGLFGIGTIRGSSRDPGKPERERGGRDAFLAGLVALRERENIIVALTPDGPRGPRMRCQAGVASLSVISRTHVIPWTFSAGRARVLGSWDRFLVPLPFSRGIIAYGEPIPPPPDRTAEAIEAHRQRIETALTALTREADAAMGRETPEPEAPR
ncbi:MAG TPA: lysophospholipid acyltransferase family protein, partial [Paracoccaceae bacterium]|nr:lysophospholipid acyltransferase family protein [Paracoccaceae bacterium]